VRVLSWLFSSNATPTLGSSRRTSAGQTAETLPKHIFVLHEMCTCNTLCRSNVQARCWSMSMQDDWNASQGRCKPEAVFFHPSSKHKSVKAGPHTVCLLFLFVTRFRYPMGSTLLIIRFSVLTAPTWSITTLGVIILTCSGAGVCIFRSPFPPM